MTDGHALGERSGRQIRWRWWGNQPTDDVGETRGQVSLLANEWGALVNRVPISRISHQIGSTAQVEFVHQVNSIARNGPHGNAELVRDVLTQRALSHHVENLPFGRRQGIMA